MRFTDGSRVEPTDAQWKVLKPLIPKPQRRPDGNDRPGVNPSNRFGADAGSVQSFSHFLGGAEW